MSIRARALLAAALADPAACRRAAHLPEHLAPTRDYQTIEERVRSEERTKIAAAEKRARKNARRLRDA